MNQQPSNQSGVNSTFSSQPASQTNPFTADLKGEFESKFGPNTNAMSQIFKEGSFAGGSKMKLYVIGGVVVLALVVAFFVLTSPSDTASEDEFADDTSTAPADTAATDPADDVAATTDPATDATATDATATDATTAADVAPTDATATASSTVAETRPVAATTSAATGPISLSSPENGASVNYDETQGPAVFSWQGGGGQIVFSRSSTMKPETLRINVSGSSFSFNNPWPGQWYWRVENSSGSSEVRSFSVSAPTRRNVVLAQPAAGSAIAGTGGQVTWQGDSAVAYYRVEVSNGDWANPQYKFSTSGNTVQLNGVAPGPYSLRVGAFSEVSGRWEYTEPVAVTVQ